MFINGSFLAHRCVLVPMRFCSCSGNSVRPSITCGEPPGLINLLFTRQVELQSRTLVRMADGRKVDHIFPVSFTAHVNWGQCYISCVVCIINLEFILFVL